MSDHYKNRHDHEQLQSYVLNQTMIAVTIILSENCGDVKRGASSFHAYYMYPIIREKNYAKK
jgi:hypothetical protein